MENETFTEKMAKLKNEYAEANREVARTRNAVLGNDSEPHEQRMKKYEAALKRREAADAAIDAAIDAARKAHAAKTEGGQA